ncbi:MAG: hypothetical protein LRY55_15990 [Leadbetterella sp.]|nr:hypothetical protein [Leadbetterella sp.]
MMPQKIIIAIIAFFSITTTYAQADKVDFIYELVWKEDSLRLDRTKKEDMILQMQEGESCFQSMVNHNFESNMVDFEKTIKSGGPVLGETAKKNYTGF